MQTDLPSRARAVRRLATASTVLVFLGGLLAGCPDPEWPAPPPVPVFVQGFEYLPDDTPVEAGTVLDTHYADQGVVLENVRVEDAGAYGDLVPESPPNVLLADSATPRHGTLVAHFVRPSDGTSSGETGKVGAVFLDVDDASEEARLEAYDRDGHCLGTAAVPVGAEGSRQYVEVTAPGIARAHLVLPEGGDGAAVDDLTYEAVPLEVFVLEAYPAFNAERKLVEAYLQKVSAGKEGDVYYASMPYFTRYMIVRFGHDEAALRSALQTPGACVGVSGHSNYGLGVLFSDQPDHSHIDWVTSISDFINVASDLVGITLPYLVESQAYPNLTLLETEIAAFPENYCTPVGMQRFPNDEGVGVCESFGAVQGEGIDRHHYHISGVVGEGVRLVVHGGSADLPDPLRYAVLYYRSCNSGPYYSESFQQGVFFYTTNDSYIGAQDILVQGLLEDWDWEAMKYQMNRRQNNNDYFDFTQSTPSGPCDPACE